MNNIIKQTHLLTICSTIAFFSLVILNLNGMEDQRKKVKVDKKIRIHLCENKELDISSDEFALFMSLIDPDLKLELEKRKPPYSFPSLSKEAFQFLVENADFIKYSALEVCRKLYDDTRTELFVELLFAANYLDINTFLTAAAEFIENNLFLILQENPSFLEAVFQLQQKLRRPQFFDDEKKDLFNDTLLIMAIKGHISIVQENSIRLISLKKWGNDIVKFLISTKADLDTQHFMGDTALICATKERKTAIVKMLIEAGAKVTIQNNYGCTALIAAAERGDEAIVKMLLDAGADVTQQNNDKETALISSAKLGRTETVRILINANADLDTQNKWGSTALISAASGGYETIVKMLIDAKAHLDMQNNSYGTALISAAKNGHTAIVKMLIDAKAALNKRTSLTTASQTALICAADKGHTEIVKLLIDAKADVNIKESDHYAVSLYKARNRGCPGNTALIYAVARGYSDIAKMLIKAGADPDTQNFAGNTALIFAATLGYEDMVEMLIDADADLGKQNKAGSTALSRAMARKRHNIVKMLTVVQSWLYAPRYLSFWLFHNL